MGFFDLLKNNKPTQPAKPHFLPHQDIYKGLRDPDWKVREQTANFLEKTGQMPREIADMVYFDIAYKNWGRVVTFGAVAVEPLIQTLSVKNKNIQASAARTLGKIGDKRAIDPLLGALNDPSWRVQTAAIDALGMFKDGRVVGSIIAKLGAGEKEERIAAVHALQEIGNQIAIPAIAQMLHDTDKDVAREANNALIAFRKPAVDYIIQHLDSDAEGDFIHFLGIVDDPRVLTPIIQQLHQAPATATRVAAAEVLGKIRDPIAVDVLIQTISNPIADIKIAALHSLGILRDTKAVKPIIQCLKERNKEVQKKALKALGAIGDSSAVPHLTEFYLNNIGDSELKKITEDVLFQIKQRHGLPFLDSRAPVTQPIIDSALLAKINLWEGQGFDVSLLKALYQDPGILDQWTKRYEDGISGLKRVELQYSALKQANPQIITAPEYSHAILVIERNLKNPDAILQVEAAFQDIQQKMNTPGVIQKVPSSGIQRSKPHQWNSDSLTRHILQDIVHMLGSSFLDNPLRIRGLLYDFCCIKTQTPDQWRPEITVLTIALNNDIPHEIYKMQKGSDFTFLRRRLVQRLTDQAIDKEAAHWAVDAWQEAIKKNFP